MSEQTDQLEHFLATDGWRWFSDRVLEEWGPQGKRYQAELDKALNLTDNDAAASQARQVRSGQKIILALLRLPFDELKRLGDAAVTTTGHLGRAPYDEELVGQSRRGGTL